MSFKINKKAVIGEVMITFVSTVVIIVILIIFALASSAMKANSSGKDKVDKINLTGEGSYSSEFGKLVDFRFFLNERDSLGNKIREFNDAYDSAFGPVITVWTPAMNNQQQGLCYYYKYLPKKGVWVASNNHGDSWTGLDDVISNIDHSWAVTSLAETLKTKKLEDGKQYLYNLKAQRGCT